MANSIENSKEDYKNLLIDKINRKEISPNEEVIITTQNSVYKIHSIEGKQFEIKKFKNGQLQNTYLTEDIAIYSPEEKKDAFLNCKMFFQNKENRTMKVTTFISDIEIQDRQPSQEENDQDLTQKVLIQQINNRDFKEGEEILVATHNSTYKIFLNKNSEINIEQRAGNELIATYKISKDKAIGGVMIWKTLKGKNVLKILTKDGKAVTTTPIKNIKAQPRTENFINRIKKIFKK